MPIFKNKDKLDEINCRQIFILHVISKVYEKVYHRLYNYFSVNNLLSSQFGFRSGASTEHALLKFSDDTCLIRRKFQLQHSWISVTRLTVWIVIFYYQNSNDMASMKLHCNGSIDTYQTVNILSPGTRLTHLYLNIGVPQGSILRPLLLLIYIKDIVNSSNIFHSFSLLMTPHHMLNMTQLMVQFKSLTRN